MPIHACKEFPAAKNNYAWDQYQITGWIEVQFRVFLVNIPKFIFSLWDCTYIYYIDLSLFATWLSQGAALPAAAVVGCAAWAELHVQPAASDGAASCGRTPEPAHRGSATTPPQDVHAPPPPDGETHHDHHLHVWGGLSPWRGVVVYVLRLCQVKEERDIGLRDVNSFRNTCSNSRGPMDNKHALQIKTDKYRWNDPS